MHSECDHPIFQSTKFEFGLRTHSQAGEDIGERMFNAFVHLTRQSPAILIGTDCPILSSDHIARCAAALIDGAEAAFAPVEDGGYALIGLRKAAWQIFEGIPWGTGDVMRLTRERLDDGNSSIFETEQLWDVDTYVDYCRAKSLGLLEDLAG